MSTLGNVTNRLQQLAAAIVHAAPTRDPLVTERDALRAAPPPDALAPPEPPSCRCPHCTTRADEEQATRVTFAAWATRVTTREAQLVKLTWGDETERDEPGQALAELCTEILRAIDENRARKWERVVEHDGRGREIRAWETGAVLGEITSILVGLYHQANGPMLFLGSTELTTAIAETRGRMVAALGQPLRRPLAPDVATRAGTEAGRAGEAERHGLSPSSGGNILEGTVKFSRRGRA